MVAMLILAFAAVVLIQTILFSKLSEHRIDIARGDDPAAGPSWIWWENVLLHAKYDERGQRVKRWVFALMAVQLGLLLAMFW
jgi:hypothetical protein